MASNTTRLGLLKKNPVTDGNDTFNIETMLNENWEKVDKNVALIDPMTGKLLAGQENTVTISDASITEKGIVMLDDAVNSPSTTKAATANAIKKVKDSVSNVGNYGIATQLEAETGTSDVKYMTPLKVKQAVVKLTPKNVPNGYASLDSNGKVVNSDGSISGKMVKISEIDLTLSPASNVLISNLSGYENLLGRLKGHKTTTASGLQVVINELSANQAYNGKKIHATAVGSWSTFYAYERVGLAANMYMGLDVEIDANSYPISYSGRCSAGDNTTSSEDLVSVPEYFWGNLTSATVKVVNSIKVSAVAGNLTGKFELWGMPR